MAFDEYATTFFSTATGNGAGFTGAAVGQRQRRVIVDYDRAVVATTGNSITSEIQRDIAGYRNITLDVLSQRSITVDLCHRRTRRRRIPGERDSLWIIPILAIRYGNDLPCTDYFAVGIRITRVIVIIIYIAIIAVNYHTVL